MGERTKTTRVEFREETVCTYTDSKFMEMNPHCNKYQYASVVEEEEFNLLGEVELTILRNDYSNKVFLYFLFILYLFDKVFEHNYRILSIYPI